MKLTPTTLARRLRSRFAGRAGDVACLEKALAEAEAKALENARLLATMSHEIRTPLNGVIGMLGLLQETELTPEQQNYAATALVSGRTLLSFIDEILDGARSAAVNKPADQDIDLTALVENVTELLSPRAQAKGIDVACRLSPDLPATITGDVTKLRQLLFNLAGNAIKFTTHGGVLISATRDGAALVLAVSDTGIGMNAAEQARIFDAYVQANDDTQRLYGGTGLGLSICRRIAGELGGTLQVASVPDEGTIFTARLPGLVRLPAPASPLPLQGRNFVLAMADGFSRDHFAAVLGDMGAEVLAHSEVTESLVADSSLAIICETATAPEIVAELQKPSRRPKPHAQVWLLYTPEERRARRGHLDKPFTGYLLKPLRRSTLVERLSATDALVLKAAGARMGEARRGRPAIVPRRILVVDDTPVNAFIARTILQRSGHIVMVSDSGHEALAAIGAEAPFDLVFLDMEMPGLSGPETARLIRAREHGTGHRLPIIALTANTRPEDVARCLAAGMDGHLPKPFDQQDLHEVIARMISAVAA